jgi:hypothetical protein
MERETMKDPLTQEAI